MKVALDMVAALFMAAFSMYLIGEGLAPEKVQTYLPAFLSSLGVLFVATLLFGVYKGSFRFAGVMEGINVFFTTGCVFVASLIACAAWELNVRFAICYFGTLTFAMLAVRFLCRFLRYLRRVLRGTTAEKKAVIIVGAGEAGRMLLREIRTSEYVNYRPACFLDDDTNKHGLLIDGVPVYGAVDCVKDAAERFHATEIFVAMPSMSREIVRGVLEKCRDSGVHTRVLPGVYQLMNGEVSIGALREVSILDLLGRDQITVDLGEIMGYIENRTVLVTGGGGSIGSELCRQIAAHKPKQLIILDIYENNAYDIEQELRRNHPALSLLTLIASVRDSGKMEDVFRTYRPEIVFNAAAHKHVPLMETSPNEAVKNNVFGTLNVVRMADKYGVRRFVQISTDKAVNPTNIMGATKRLCEMIVQAYSRRSKTEFVAVRFGNVLGSNGSVIPLFKKQIAEGGPVTVTHKDIIRYFMTIPEAVSLVLQAGAYAKGGEIFVLDMGEPVRIYDLAENLIRLSGLEPGVDIEIRCTGLRPGEKLFEERLMDEEGLSTTQNGMISVARPILFEEEPFFTALDRLYEAAYAETDRMKEMVAELVPTYSVDRENQ
ncbi:MAG: polysaccharide biosynthesis protein [Clostridia bacterium]|nr:polysaccharide biosynthesis protein [Clostridia bacterium]